MTGACSSLLSVPVTPDWPGLLRCLRREGTPGRVYFIELFLDPEVQQAVCDRFGLLQSLNRSDPAFEFRKLIAVQRFLGYDYVRCGVDAVPMPMKRLAARDTAELTRADGRSYVDEHVGPITNWQEFEAYPWPDPAAIDRQARGLPA
jgi:uroporphyrinogen decarboxylase